MFATHFKSIGSTLKHVRGDPADLQTSIFEATKRTTQNSDIPEHEHKYVLVTDWVLFKVPQRQKGI